MITPLADEAAPASSCPPPAKPGKIPNLVQVRTIMLSITEVARFFPFLIDYRGEDCLRLKIADQYNLVQTMREVRLNNITWKLAVKGVRSVDAQLIWVEPFIWALLKLRWTPAPPPDAASVSIRERTCSWPGAWFNYTQFIRWQRYASRCHLLGCALRLRGTSGLPCPSSSGCTAQQISPSCLRKFSLSSQRLVLR